MSQDKTKSVQWGPVKLMEGISAANAWTFMFASLFAIGLLGFFNFGQAFILTEVLKVPPQELGVVSGQLQFWAEIQAIIYIPICGILADRFGRRPLFVVGTILLGFAFLLFPYAQELFDLYLFRIVHALGAAAIATALATIVNDYPKEQSRGAFVGFSSIANGIGVGSAIFFLGGLPEVLQSQGMDSLESAKAAWMYIGLGCFGAAIILQLGLKPGTPSSQSQRIPAKKLFVDGIKAAKNPRIGLAYANSFAARAELTVIGVFVNIWAQKAGAEAGIGNAEAMAMVGGAVAATQGVALLWAPCMGFIIDRVNRVTAMAIATALGALGYLGIGFVESPIEAGAIPFFAFLGLGYVSGLIASTALIGQEAPVEERGAVIGFFGMSGAIGILVVVVVGGWLADIVDVGPFLLMGTINAVLFVWCLVVRFKAGEPEVKRSGLGVVITGSTRGIGLGLAKNFLEQGNDVMVTSRSQSAVDQAIAQLRPTADKHGVKVVGQPCDVGSIAEVQSLWDKARADLGKVNIWINNAGIANKGMAIEDMPQSEIETVVGANLRGTMNACQVALKGMEAQGFGEIYNFEGFGSDGNQNPGLSIYGSTKNAITHFTNALIKETKKSPVKVGFLSPGIVITDMSVGEGQINPERYEQTRKVYNIIGDNVDTVTPWLARNTLLNERHGARIAWLTKSKVIWRFLTAKWNKRDLFAEAGIN